MAPTETAYACLEAIAVACRDSIANYDLDQPRILGPSTGAAMPVADACDGMVWCRLGSIYPTDGSGAAFIAARPSWDVPAWCIPIEVGVLWCHDNITEDGGYIDAEREALFAERDSQYRLALMDAVGFRWRPVLPDPLAEVVAGQVLLPWQPIGPDGGYSGGILVAQVIATALGYGC